MPSRKKSRSRSTRANLMVAVGSALYFLILLLALYVMDRQVYTAGKMEIVRDNFLEIFHPPDNINEEARQALYAMPKSRREAQRRKLKKSLEAIVNGPTSLYSMGLVDEAGRVVVEATNPQKPSDLNTFENNLFIREFSGRTSQNVSPIRSLPNTTATLSGHLTGTYTSPMGVPEIEKLTRKYRMYAVILIAVWILAWMGIYYYLLRPVRNVTLHLDRSRDGAPSLIPNARGGLEHGYNELAASALLQMIEEKLNAAARPGESETAQGGSRSTVIRDAMALAGKAFGADHFRVGLLGETDTPNAATEQYEWRSSKGADAKLPPLVFLKETGETRITPYDDNSGFTWYAPLASGCMQADCHYRGGRARNQEFHEYLVRACYVLRGGFVAFQAYTEQLFRERSEANISLSRNMGHDLTNIIATSKLELMGIKSVLSKAAPGTTLSDQRATILSESVSGLLQSTRFMQEMVNIYRSFSYVKRPAYERRPLAPLIEDFLKMFEPALSSRVTIHRELADDMPAPIVEPRLLKLALFNVLQNALDAIKRCEEMEPDTGKITVTAVYVPDPADGHDGKHTIRDGHFEIFVRDNGPGIRDESGRKLDTTETQAIFDYGYSTKGEAGEGLGLNWVQTIMTDFHDGGVRGENQPDGGTQITLWLRSMERKEARVGK